MDTRDFAGCLRQQGSAIAHGTRDSVVPIEDSRALARAAGVELMEIEDEHRLDSLLEGERLAELIRQLI
jgi:hypothetical protein